MTLRSLFYRIVANVPNIVLSNLNTSANTISATGISDFSEWAVGNTAPPTAAEATVSGRVLNANWQGIRNARLYMTAQDGTIRTASTGSFGYYRFENVPIGGIDVVTVVAKRYRFDNATQIVQVGDNVTDLDFTATE